MRKNLNKAAIRKAGARPVIPPSRTPGIRPGVNGGRGSRGYGPNKAMPNPNRKQAPF